MVEDSGKITIDKVASQALWNLYNLINNRSNVPDPLNPSDTGTTRTRKMVYTSMPDFGGNFFKSGFPFIIVHSAKPSKGKSTADLTKTFRNYDLMVEVYAQDLDGDTTGNKVGIDQRSTIVNNIIKTLESPSNRKTLITYGQAHLEYNVDIDDEAELDGKRVYAAEFDINFGNNLSSSS